MLSLALDDTSSASRLLRQTLAAAGEVVLTRGHFAASDYSNHDLPPTSLGAAGGHNLRAGGERSPDGGAEGDGRKRKRFNSTLIGWSIIKGWTRTHARTARAKANKQGGGV